MGQWKTNNFNIYNVILKKSQKPPQKTCKYHYKSLNMISSSWDIKQNKLKLVILGHFLPFVPLKTPKIKILRNEKICWRYNHFTHMHEKLQSHDVWFLKYRVRQTKFFVILGHFLPFHHPHLVILIIKIKKNNKNAWRYYPFIHTCAP